MTKLTLSLLVICGATLMACPSPKMPTGPSPEYEDPPKPSWLEAGAQDNARWIALMLPVHVGLWAGLRGTRHAAAASIGA